MGKAKLSGQDFVTIVDISNHCMVSPATVRRWIKDHKLNAYRLPGGHFRVTLHDFKDFEKYFNIRSSN
jgi:excisionase family DNA binding protein